MPKHSTNEWFNVPTEKDVEEVFGSQRWSEALLIKAIQNIHSRLHYTSDVVRSLDFETALHELCHAELLSRTFGARSAVSKLSIHKAVMRMGWLEQEAHEIETITCEYLVSSWLGYPISVHQVVNNAGFQYFDNDHATRLVALCTSQSDHRTVRGQEFDLARAIFEEAYILNQRREYETEEERKEELQSEG